MSFLLIFWNGFSEDFKKKNFSLYGQWLGIIGIFLCIALGVANLVGLFIPPSPGITVFSIICIVQGLVVMFVEIPFFLKICPMTEKFINFIKLFDSNMNRFGFYLLNAALQYLTLLFKATLLLTIAIWFTITSGCYVLAMLKHQEFETTQLGSAETRQELGHEAVRNVL